MALPVQLRKFFQDDNFSENMVYGILYFYEILILMIYARSYTLSLIESVNGRPAQDVLRLAQSVLNIQKRDNAISSKMFDKIRKILVKIEVGYPEYSNSNNSALDFPMTYLRHAIISFALLRGYEIVQPGELSPNNEGAFVRQVSILFIKVFGITVESKIWDDVMSTVDAELDAQITALDMQLQQETKALEASESLQRQAIDSLTGRRKLEENLKNMDEAAAFGKSKFGSKRNYGNFSIENVDSIYASIFLTIMNHLEIKKDSLVKLHRDVEKFKQNGRITGNLSRNEYIILMRSMFSASYGFIYMDKMKWGLKSRKNMPLYGNLKRKPFLKANKADFSEIYNTISDYAYNVYQRDMMDAVDADLDTPYTSQKLGIFGLIFRSPNRIRRIINNRGVVFPDLVLGFHMYWIISHLLRIFTILQMLSKHHFSVERLDDPSTGIANVKTVGPASIRNLLKTIDSNSVRLTKGSYSDDYLTLNVIGFDKYITAIDENSDSTFPNVAKVIGDPNFSTGIFENFEAETRSEEISTAKNALFYYAKAAWIPAKYKVMKKIKYNPETEFGRKQTRLLKKYVAKFGKDGALELFTKLGKVLPTPETRNQNNRFKKYIALLK